MNMTPEQKAELNETMLTGLRYRRDRIQELIPLQDHEDAKTLLSAEALYVNQTIEYREKHGGLHKIILNSPTTP